MATWANTTLSTASTLEAVESLSSKLMTTDQTAAKITRAKKLLKRQIEAWIAGKGITVDESDSEILIDVIANPEIFDVTSDYLTLFLLYQDLYFNNSEGLYMAKRDYYETEWEDAYILAQSGINWDYDQDGTVDDYRKVTVRTLEL